MAKPASRPLLYDPPMLEGDLEEIRQRVLGEDSFLFALVGMFVSSYSACEANIDHLLMRLCQVPQAPLYRALSRGMDGPTKARRLIEVAKYLEVTIDPPLRQRIDHFLGPIVGLRNNVAHLTPIKSKDGKKIEFHHLATLLTSPNWPNEPDKPEAVMIIDFFERAVWLNSFASDLSGIGALFAGSLPPKILQIARYQASLPRVAPPKSAQARPIASADTLPQTAPEGPQGRRGKASESSNGQ